MNSMHVAIEAKKAAENAEDWYASVADQDFPSERDVFVAKLAGKAKADGGGWYMRSASEELRRAVARAVVKHFDEIIQDAIELMWLDADRAAEQLEQDLLTIRDSLPARKGGGGNADP